MTTRLSRERALTCARDHLHTPATALARYASKAAVDAATATRVGATTSGVDVGPSRVKSSVKTSIVDKTSIIETLLVKAWVVATSGSETPAPARIEPSGLRAAGLHGARTRRRARVSSWRRVGAAFGALLFALFGSATLVGSTATAGSGPGGNSVLAFGPAPVLGSGAGLELHAGVIGMASDPSGPGYWLAAADGGVFAFGAASFFGSTGGATLNAPVVGIAATPGGRGYWLVGADGGVFAFGDAAYYGSMAGTPLAAPVTAIIATRDGGGYWLVGADGGVFAFGDARFFGSAQSLNLAHPIVGATMTSSGKGYWLLGSDGGVFSFGDARFAGALPDPSQSAVSIAASPDGRGYWIAHADGSVSGFDVSLAGNNAIFTAATGEPRTVAVAPSSVGGYWIAQGAVDTTSALSSDPFLACTRAHESDSAGGYGAVSAGGTYRGAYQFDRSTWNSAARLAGRSDLIGVDPAAASPADQDLLALDLFHARSRTLGRSLRRSELTRDSPIVYTWTSPTARVISRSGRSAIMGRGSSTPTPCVGAPTSIAGARRPAISSPPG